MSEQTVSGFLEPLILCWYGAIELTRREEAKKPGYRTQKSSIVTERSASSTNSRLGPSWHHHLTRVNPPLSWWSPSIGYIPCCCLPIRTNGITCTYNPFELVTLFGHFKIRFSKRLTSTVVPLVTHRHSTLPPSPSPSPS
jgi:hypothetical protein